MINELVRVTIEVESKVVLDTIIDEKRIGKDKG